MPIGTAILFGVSVSPLQQKAENEDYKAERLDRPQKSDSNSRVAQKKHLVAPLSQLAPSAALLPTFGCPDAGPHRTKVLPLQFIQMVTAIAGNWIQQSQRHAARACKKRRIRPTPKYLPVVDCVTAYPSPYQKGLHASRSSDLFVAVLAATPRLLVMPLCFYGIKAETHRKSSVRKKPFAVGRSIDYL